MTNQPLKIACDVDGPMLDFFGTFTNFYNRRNRTNFSISQMKTYDFCKFLQTTEEHKEQEMEEFYKSPLFRMLPVADYAREGLTLLRKKGAELYVLTSRPNKVSRETISQIRFDFPDIFSKFHLTNGHGEGVRERKLDVCVKNGYTVIIEDYAKEANECAEGGMKAILITKPWNADETLHKNVTRAEDLLKAAQYLIQNKT